MALVEVKSFEEVPKSVKNSKLVAIRYTSLHKGYDKEEAKLCIIRHAPPETTHFMIGEPTEMSQNTRTGLVINEYILPVLYVW